MAVSHHVTDALLTLIRHVPDAVWPFHRFDALRSQSVELVLTAHPTEVNRRTLLLKQARVMQLIQPSFNPHSTLIQPSSNPQARVMQLLHTRDDAAHSATPYEREGLENELRREIASLWETDELRRRVVPRHCDVRPHQATSPRH